MLGEQFVFHLWSDGTRHIVLGPDQKVSLMWQKYEELGHVGMANIGELACINKLLLMSRNVKFVTESGLASTLCHLNRNFYLPLGYC